MTRTPRSFVVAIAKAAEAEKARKGGGVESLLADIAEPSQLDGLLRLA